MNTSDAAIAFFHANGYPPGVYRAFFEALKAQVGQSAEIVSAPLLATPDDAAATLRWPTMLRMAQEHAALHQANTLLGHSMGGYLALQVAAAEPERYRRVVLIDSPIPRHWRSGLLSFSKLTGLSYKFGPAPIANGRRSHWVDHNSAREHFAAKAFVTRWHPGVLDDFIEHALRGMEGGVTLAIPRESERDIYANIVHREALAAYRAAIQRGVRVNFIAGERSEELRLAGRESNRSLFAPNYVELSGLGHLIPFESPERCAAAVVEALSLPSAIAHRSKVL